MATSRDGHEVEVAPSALQLVTERLGPLPIVNHFLGRLGLDALVGRFVPTRDRSTGLPAAKGLGVLLRSVLVERQPIYQQGETVRGFAPSCFGLEPDELGRVGDDAIGRGLDRLFDTDRASLLTEVVVAAARRFDLCFEELHNDSTTVKLTGQYRAARGRRLRGKRAAWITYGFSKDHRPDLKQLLFILTTTADGGVPVQFRCGDGSTNDARTHIETWEELRRVTGRADFLYVADCKLCTRDNMDYIDRQGGRFVTVMPRSRSEDEEFRRWIQTNDPPWEVVRSRPNPRRESGPRDVWRVFRCALPTREAFPMFWVWSTLLALNQEQSRRERLTRAFQDLAELRARLVGPRPRLRSVAEVDRLAREILRDQDVERYVEITVRQVEEHDYRQERPGRPRPDTLYRRRTRHRVALDWTLVDAMVAFDRKSDGMYPLITNDRSLTGAQVLDAHKGQPRIEKRFSQLKCVHEIAPVFLKNEGRIEALFFLYFLGLLTQGLIERELRVGNLAGPLDGRTVLVQGAAGAVGRCAVHLARRRGATVVATVRKPEQREVARRAGANEVFLAGDELESRLRALAPDGVEVAFATNIELDLAVLRNGGSIATYATNSPRPVIPFWPLVFDNIRIDFLGSDDFPAEAKARAARELTASLAEGWRPFGTFDRYPLAAIAAAHEQVESGQPRGKVVLEVG